MNNFTSKCMALRSYISNISNAFDIVIENLGKLTPTQVGARACCNFLVDLFFHFMNNYTKEIVR